MSISHLFYADGVLLFFVVQQEINQMMKIIQQYGIISGQLPNLQKSGLFFSKNATRELKRRIYANIGIGLTERNIIYLGNPLFIQRNKARDFQSIIIKLKP